MAGTSGDGGRLSPDQHALLQEAIVAELRRAWDEAVAAGVPPERLAAVVENRRREILSAAAGRTAPGADDRHDGGDDAVDDSRVTDQ